MSDCRVEADFSALEKLASELGKGHYVDVGYLGGETSENGLTVAEIMAVHEFGSPERNIPRRSQILDPILQKQAEIAQSVDKSKDELIAKGDIDGIFKYLGMACEAAIQEAFESSGDGTWAPLSENYKVRPSGQPVDESSKPLIDTGLARKSITSETGNK